MDLLAQEDNFLGINLHTPNVSDIDFKSELNQEQYEAVTAGEGPALVLAGAGSGKTRTLTYRVAWLLTQGIKPWEILLLTFTNKASKEMLGRVERITGMPAHLFWGGTFHHIGQKFLRSHSHLLGLDKSFNILDEGDAESLLSEVIRTQSPGFFKNKDHPKARIVSDIFSYMQNTLQDMETTLQDKYPHLYYLKSEFQIFWKYYQEQKIKQKVVDYDDLLVFFLKILKDHPEVASIYQKRFKHILVDEYQDTNALQSAIINTLAQDHQIMAVGDDAQCIYTWRGADFENILTFTDKHPRAQIYKIQTNYRSTPNILSFANGILEQHPKGFSKELKAVRSSYQAPYFVPVTDTREQAQFIIRRIQALLNGGARLSDIAILYRAHYQAMDIQMELSRHNIPYQITSGVRFFEQAHIKDLVAQLRFVNNPNDVTAFCRFTALLPKVGAKTSEKLLSIATKEANAQEISLFKALELPSVVSKVPESAKEIWVDMAYTLQDMAESLKSQSPEVITGMAIDGWYSDFLKTIYTNWRSRQDDLESLKAYAARQNSMVDLLTQLMLLSSEISDRGSQSDENSLRLSTVHQAKGLEFPVVFIIGLADNWFPLKRAIDEGNLDEELRLFYVAVTRAQDELYLVSPKVSIQGGPPTLLQPSRFITNLETELYQTLHIRPRALSNL